ncbi:MAG: type III secretion system inner membrane ring subunit SctD, partial [Desulfovibrionales bacterium]|nr:type III secretion system inner membrane ring subunit SctD [Desulfovibrionales bacterium]
IVNTDAERLQILRLAQSLQSPVYLNVQVRADRSGAIAHAFAQRGFFPEIRENAHGNNTSFVVRGYMKDSSTENSVFTALEEDFQAAGTLNFVRNIRHANDVSAAIEPLLSHSSLDFTQIQFQPGVVLLAGSYSAEQRDRLEAIMSQVQQQLEVPVPFEIISAQTVHRAVSDQAQPAESEDIPTSAQDAPKPHTQSRGFEVTGVTMAPLRFITLSTGECIFEGGLLPSGHILEAISTQELQLSKDKTRFTYTLRGANE